jgi:ABC-type Fe3+ transport system substrate-binding protein
MRRSFRQKNWEEIMARSHFMPLCASVILAATAARAADAALIAAAKKEGEVVWYTTLIVNQAVRPIIEAFQAKYPGITVRYNRADSVPTAIKIIDEGRAGSPQADVFDGIETEPPVAAAGFVAPYVSAHAGLYPPALRDANGLWLATNLYFLTPGYNTNLVKPAEAPKTLDDLLDPRWKGKIVWSNARSAGGPIFVGSVLRHLGEEKGMIWLKKFSKQQVVNAYITARAVLDQVIAGEYPLVLQIFNHHSALSAKKGAPSQWLKLEPVMVQTELHAITAAAPHPNAAKLFLEYMISKEGQLIFQKADYFPTRSDVPASMPELAPSTGGFKAAVMSPDDIARDYEKWAALYIQLFR